MLGIMLQLKPMINNLYVKEDDEDLEDFPGDNNESEYLLGEIEDLKQQLVDLQEEKTFCEEELNEKLNAEKEETQKMRVEIERLRSDKSDNVCS